MNNDLEQFSDLDLEAMAHGNNPVANAYRELLEFRRAAKQSSLTIDFSKMSQAEIDDIIERLGNTGGGHITAVTTPKVNSPAIPDGWKLVPIEPTDAMQVAAANAIRFDTTAINKLWTGKRVFDAMLAAAPKPESEL